MTNLENKIQDADKIPQKLTGKCNVCKTEDAIFTYVGRQTFRIAAPIELYNCNRCQATYGLDSLVKKYGAKPIQ